jgi:XTP/dITP diphosphohydrolase
VGFPPRLALATKNPGKIREILAICADWPVEWITFAAAAPERFGKWPDVEETGETYLQNALLKARAVAESIGTPAVADDSGIEVDALGGQPGVMSARFAGRDATDEQNLRLLVSRVRAAIASPPILGAEPLARAGGAAARYRCIAACAWPDGRWIWEEGTCEGRLVFESRGSGGFGYDPIFVPNDEVRTMAELGPEEKDAISHRGKAFRALGRALSRPVEAPRAE